ncbi:polynucleotidyl transferase [Striga asiatica]|uniref:Polynucleotidyl transferase n=1 Tax=Striga asiatica TaxID=4170 RepID=A0A5A7QC87_STRAF|nr:polynucleotidyl transferase [Striga asiatica]
MAGTVYLRTDRFEVKLEGITFKTKDFESLCKVGFLFPEGDDWAGRPIVGLDVMAHPRDPSIILLLLCFGMGCVILRFAAGESLPAGIHKFLADKRIHVVCFGIPEKSDLFPFDELGLTRNESDIGYLASKILKDPKYRKSELDELARKVLGIKRMIGLTEASSFERHEQIKCAICQLFITTVISMGLVGAKDTKKSDYVSKKSSFRKNLNSLHLLADGWFKLPKVIHHRKKRDDDDDISRALEEKNEECRDDGAIVEMLVNAEVQSGEWTPRDGVFEKESGGGEGEEKKRRIKGILKCPSMNLRRSESFPADAAAAAKTPPSPSTPVGQEKCMLRRANSKGCNVSFKFH